MKIGGGRRAALVVVSGLLPAWLALRAPAALAGERAYVVATAVRQPYTAPDRTGFLDLLVAEMFRRVGARGEMHVYESPERPLINADMGVDDGTALRMRGLERQYPHLVRVPEKLLDNDFVAYSLRHRFSTTDWKSLAPYHVAYLIGWKAFENNLPADQARTAVNAALAAMKRDGTYRRLFDRCLTPLAPGR